MIVHKRINTRIFFNQSRGNGIQQFTNAQPGTVVDHAITKPSFQNFYLVSQSVNQGTVSPTHYVVACNDMGMPLMELQRITYQLTYMYFNWPGAVRCPVPVQYAHKLAYQVGENLKRDPKEKLANTLFYLWALVVFSNIFYY